MRARPLAATLVLALGAWCGAATVQAQDLLQIWRDALANDPTYDPARASYRASIEQLPHARPGLLPAVRAEHSGRYDETRATRSSAPRSRGGTRGTPAL